MKKSKKKGWIFFIVVFFVILYAAASAFKLAVLSVQNLFSSGREEVQIIKPTRERTLPPPASRECADSNIYTTPVREYTPQAQWVGKVKMFRDQGGYFITAPGVRVNGGVPFEDFAKKHPEQARVILGR